MAKKNTIYAVSGAILGIALFLTAIPAAFGQVVSVQHSSSGSFVSQSQTSVSSSTATSSSTSTSSATGGSATSSATGGSATVDEDVDVHVDGNDNDSDNHDNDNDHDNDSRRHRSLPATGSNSIALFGLIVLASGIAFVGVKKYSNKLS